MDNKLIAPMIYKDTMCSHFFEKWFKEMLLPILDKKSLIILDNARFHRMKILQKMANEYGHIVLPLPPYSPELNPIEKTWANIKKYLRKFLSPNHDNFENIFCLIFN